MVAVSDEGAVGPKQLSRRGYAYESLWHGLIPVVIRAGGWAGLITAFFFVLSALSLRTDKATAIVKVRYAFDHRVIAGEGDWLGANVGIGAHQWNDCLVINQAIDRRSADNRLMISPVYTGPQRPTSDPCPYAYAFAHGRPAIDQPAFYHRYIHGHTVLIRLLLAKFSVLEIRYIYSSLIALFLMMGVAQAMVTLAKGCRPRESVFWFITLFSFARFYGLESVGQSLAHGPSDLVLAGFVLFLVRCSAQGGFAREKVPGMAAVFGAMTIIFEFLSGGIPLGLALLVGGLPFALKPAQLSEDESDFRVIAKAALAFSISILVVISIKIILVAVVFGTDNLEPIWRQLTYRIGLPAPEIGNEEHNGIAPLIANLIGNMGALAAGQALMSGLLLIISTAAGIWSFRHAIQVDCIHSRRAYVALASSNLVIISWIAIFMHHTSLHARFMDRLFVWFIISGLSLFALTMMDRIILRSTASLDGPSATT